MIRTISAVDGDHLSHDIDGCWSWAGWMGNRRQKRTEKQKHQNNFFLMLKNDCLIILCICWFRDLEYFSRRVCRRRVCRWTFFSWILMLVWLGDTLCRGISLFGDFLQRDKKKTEKRNVDSWSKFRIDVFLCGAMFGVPRSIVAEQWKSINKTDTKNEKSMWHTEDSINYRFDTFWFQISFLFSLSVAKEVYLETISLLFRCFGCHRKATRARLGSQSMRADGRWVIARCRRTVRILRVYRPR